MTFSFKVPTQKIIKYCILQFSTFHVRTYIKSSEFQSRSELLIIEYFLPLADEVTVDLVLKCLQLKTVYVTKMPTKSDKKKNKD